MIKNYFFLFLYFFCLKALASEPSVNIESYIKAIAQKEVAKECPTCDVDLVIHNKKLLDDVAVPDQIIADRWRGQTNLILKMGDESRIVTVTIRWSDDVVIATKNIKQGQVIQEPDLKTIKKDVTFLKEAYVNKISAVVGWEGRKIFRRGQIIEENYLKKPLAIKYGQPIKLHLREGSLILTMMAQARGAGAVGDRIPVYIPKTRKKLSAIVVDSGSARIE